MTPEQTLAVVNAVALRAWILLALSGGVSANGARRSLAGSGAALDSRLHGRLPGSCRGLLAALVLEALMPPVPVLASLRLPLTLVSHIRQPALGEVLPIRTLFA
jgi:hypothetical protein